MSVDAVPIVDDLRRTLRTLLEKARKVKQSTSINPPLPAADFENDIVNIGQILASTSTASEAQSSPPSSAVEIASRQLLYELLAAYTVSDDSFFDICNLLDIVQFCADHAQCDASLPLLLVEELLDSQTIDGCKRVFDFLESRRQRMITSEFGKNKGKQLIVLRSCNELLRRLSRAEDAVFCGRVFMFLFQSFPLGDKSSVNLRGEFHTENVTVFDQPTTKGDDAIKVEEQQGDNNEDRMDVDDSVVHAANPGLEDGKSGTTDSTTVKPNGATVDVGNKKEEEIPDINMLYTTFWSLQNVFSNPSKLFAAEEFTAFKHGLEATLQKFKSVPKVLQTHGTPRNPGQIFSTGQGIKRKRDDRNGEAFASNFNPKYLTSRDLFELEISDLTFQRHILVQALIVIDFLLSLTPKAKKKIADLKAQKAMLYNFTLSPEDTTWATTTRTQISTYLQEFPEGKFYYRMIDTVLSRDKNWVRWKTESCPPISLPPVSATSYAEAMAAAKRYCMPRRPKRSRVAVPVGSLELGFIDEDEDKDAKASAEKRLSRLRNGWRDKVKDVETYVREVEAAELDLEFLPPPTPQPTKEELEEKRLKKIEARKAAAKAGDGKKEEEEGEEEEGEEEEKISPNEWERRRLQAIIKSGMWRISRLAVRRQLSKLDAMGEGAKGLRALLPKSEEEDESREEIADADVDEIKAEDAEMPDTDADVENTTAAPADAQANIPQDTDIGNVIPEITISSTELPALEDNSNLTVIPDGDTKDATVTVPAPTSNPETTPINDPNIKVAEDTKLPDNQAISEATARTPAPMDIDTSTTANDQKKEQDAISDIKTSAPPNRNNASNDEDNNNDTTKDSNNVHETGNGSDNDNGKDQNENQEDAVGDGDDNGGGDGEDRKHKEYEPIDAITGSAKALADRASEGRSGFGNAHGSGNT